MVQDIASLVPFVGRKEVSIMAYTILLSELEAGYFANS